MSSSAGGLDEEIEHDAITASNELYELVANMRFYIRQGDGKALSRAVDHARQKLQVLYAVAALWESKP